MFSCHILSVAEYDVPNIRLILKKESVSEKKMRCIVTSRPGRL
ncbi:hypothetical protein BACCOPRO_01736 [Phocaeicola coprophilus DSM 18228 = JCM 13818]|uniref:Uncharacterized protein n=1 Tax=Phocaeicola coprophilus DSM 18228 = JCM 13818 TaxID=547042 RepID=S0F795_9BACT|nr:hypothetical protein BACCOPRO_01736 [Phocaeicola coprophilus DSM 18228 = JCM 13818]